MQIHRRSFRRRLSGQKGGLGSVCAVGRGTEGRQGLNQKMKTFADGTRSPIQGPGEDQGGFTELGSRVSPSC